MQNRRHPRIFKWLHGLVFLECMVGRYHNHMVHEYVALQIMTVGSGHGSYYFFKTNLKKIDSWYMVNRKQVSDHISHHVALEEMGKRSPPQELGRESVWFFFLFQSTGFSPHLGGKYFSTAPVLYVSLFLLDFVHKIHQCIISMPFCVDTVRSPRAHL